MKKFTDKWLDHDIAMATIKNRRAEEAFRNQRRNISDAGWEMLASDVSASKAELDRLLEERARRQVKPDGSPVETAPKVGRMIEQPLRFTPATGAASVHSRSKGGSLQKNEISEEQEKVSIIVFDHGLPRTWRPGDPIHRKK